MKKSKGVVIIAVILACLIGLWILYDYNNVCDKHKSGKD